MRSAPREHRLLLRSLLTEGQADRVEKIRNLILPSKSIDYARDKAKMLIKRAQDAISTLADSEVKRVLTYMADFVITRPM
jgi:geranylgeranyl pyrophosphate synthase